MKMSKRIIGCLLAILLVCGLSVGVLAASVTTSVGGATVSVGQSFTVSVIFRGNGANLGSLDAAITYDTSKLTCNSASASKSTAVAHLSGNRVVVSLSDIDGVSSLQINLNFTAKAAGSATVSASVSGATDQDLNAIGSVSGGSATVTVKTPTAPSTQPSSKPQSSQASSKPSSRPQSSQPQSSAPVEDPQDTTIRVTVDGQEKIVVNSLIGVEFPEGFEVRQDEYRGQAVDVLSHTVQDMLLMYLTDADGTNGAYYRFDRMADSFYPFVRITVNAARYTLLEVPSGTKIPSGWTPPKVRGEAVVPSYQSEDPAYESFYLIYATNEQGQAGFYLYDSVEGTVQRYVKSNGYEPVTNPDGMTAADPNGNFFERLLADRAIFVTMCVAWALVVLIAGAWLVFHFARKQAHVSDKQRKKKEEKITKKLEKRAKKAAKKNKIAHQKPEIGSLDEEIEAETPENEAEMPENDAEVTEKQEETEAETAETETQPESEITE